MIDCAIIGLGWWGRHLVGALPGGSAKARVVRAVDVDAAAREFAEESGLAFSTEFQDALDDPDVQALILTTPHSLHDEQVVRAAAAGKHVFVEKPLALTVAGAKRAVAACERAGVILGVGHERRFEPALIEIKRMLRHGELGTFMHVEANFSHDILAGLSPDNWRLAPSEAPAAGMTGMGVHLTDSFVEMVGPIAEVYAMTARRVFEHPSSDVVSTLVRFENGATGHLNAISATPFFMRFHVFGSAGWAEARDTVHPAQEGITHLTIRRKQGEEEVRDVPSIDAARANIEAFADAVAGRAPYPFTADEKLHNIAVLEAIIQSDRSGEPVPVRLGPIDENQDGDPAANRAAKRAP